MQLLGRLGLAEDVEGQAVLAAVTQPFLDRQAIALGLGYLLALFVEEHLVDHALGLLAAEHARDLARLHAAIGQVLAVHLVIDAQRHPAHRPVDLPLQLRTARQHRLLDGLALIDKAHDSRLGIDHLDRHLQHHARPGADRHDRRIGRRTLGTQRRQHDVEDRLIVAQHAAQRLVERAAAVTLGRGDELVIEAELVEKGAQHRVVVMREAFELAERIGDLGQRLA